ncbi:hypothetical protein CLV63_12043 [Murinocardiopsis flavida]|uniref:TadE-like protein n=1 Tax=Murinocardiopsis flavida TaxID=645275 RepID=A0A2P8D285_9ACTN|nr:pilus assembly protein TadE [Murinocardiopsis flavida]PSK91317.1 hypothetical protein CLV63_12043 [Murinocardiopsis flavida]
MITRIHRAARRGDRGAQIIEFAAFFPFLLAAIVLAMEVYFSFTAIERIEAAARAGARVAGPQGLGSAQATARASLPSWLDHAEVRSGYTGNGVYTQVSVDTPIMWQSAPFDITLTRRVEMPVL